MPVKQFRELHKMVDRIFEQAVELDVSLQWLAAKAGLSEKTVYNLMKFTTMYPRLQTVYLLARAVGLHLELRLADSYGKSKKGRAA